MIFAKQTLLPPSSDNPLECDCEMGWLVNASKSEDGGGGGGGGVPDMDTARCLVPMSGERRLVRETQVEKGKERGKEIDPNRNQKGQIKE